MSDPQPTVPEPAPQAGGERRRLDRAPGQRYLPDASGRGGGPGGAGGPDRRRTVRPVVAAALVADAGAVLFFVVGLVDLGVGLLAVAAFIGWVVALALVWWGRDAIAVERTRVAVAALLGGWAIVAAILVDWGYALAQGGVLGLLDYVGERYGAVAPVSILIAAGIAAVRAR
jgi:hypothetical protein